jgi:hypothetical protein
MKIRLLLSAFLSLTMLAVDAQDLAFYGFLPAINLTGSFGGKINVNLFSSTTIDAVNERIGGIEYPATDFQFYLQPSVIYVHSPQLNFAASYTYQRNNPFQDNFVNEHRLWQQVIYAMPLGAGKLNQRLRLEERFIENRVTSKYPYFTRARYQIGYNQPLQGRTLEAHEFYLNTYNEFYFSLTGAKNATYSDNWTYGGVGYDLGNLGRFEVGYLFQTAVRNAQKDLRFLNLAQVMWVKNFSLKKKT